MIAIDTNYPNYDGIKYYSYERDLDKSPEEVCDRLLKDIDCTKLLKPNMQLHKTTDLMYEENCYKYIRHLFRIKNQIVYNQYLDKFIAQIEENIAFEANFSIPVKGASTKKKTTKTVANKYIRTVTWDMFTNTEQYLYENPKTGDSFISTNPNLLDTLNAKKKKEKVVETITLKLKRTNLNIQGDVKI